MTGVFCSLLLALHDRTGRLEKFYDSDAYEGWLHDRTGRLEIYILMAWFVLALHDRTGRLETEYPRR